MVQTNRYIVLSTVIGALVGYAVVSPFAMVFFHAAHASMGAVVLQRMQSSVIGAVAASLCWGARVWWLPFCVLGAALGAAVGVAFARLHARQLAAEQNALELGAANDKLNDALKLLVQADKMASLGLLAGTVIHDIRNQLTFLLLTCECELEALPAGNRDASVWRELFCAAQRIHDLCDQVRRYSRKSEGTKIIVSVHDVVNEAWALVRRSAERAHVRVVVSLGAGVSAVQGNAGELLQVLVNLAQNALDAMPTGGTLTIATYDWDGGAVGRGVEVRVTDTGVGIPAEQLVRIFDAFFTTKPEDRGTGLGLSVSRAIIGGHGGSIDVQSRPGEGSTFRLHLPCGRLAVSTAEHGQTLTAQRS